MKALTLYQPWATLVMLGAKKIETRSWGTKYRGPLAIHASKSFPGRNKLLMFKEPFFSILKEDAYFDMEGDLPTGCILGAVVLVDCIRIEEAPLVGPKVQVALWREFLISYQENAFGDYRSGRFMWILENPTSDSGRIATKGKLGLWEWEE